MEKGDDRRHLRIRQQRVQLGLAHFTYRIIERWCTAVVEIGWRRRDVTQTWYAQNCRIWRGQRMEYAVALEQIAANIYALMAGDAAQGFEQTVSVQFVRRERGGVSSEPAIETASWCHQRSLKTCDGVDDVVHVRGAAIGGQELVAQ